MFLMVGGVAFAYSVVWSGTAVITIDPPSATTTTPPPTILAPLEVTEVYVGSGNNGQHDGTISGGVWSFSTSDDPSGQGTLYVKVYNPKTTSATLQSFINGVSTPLGSITIALGVEGRAYKAEAIIGPGVTVTFIFTINIDNSIAIPGTLPGISLEIREV